MFQVLNKLKLTFRGCAFHYGNTVKCAFKLPSVPFIQYLYSHPSIKTHVPALQTQKENLQFQTISFNDSIMNGCK